MRYSILAPFALAAISFVRAQVIHNVTVGGLNHDGTPIFTPTRLVNFLTCVGPKRKRLTKTINRMFQ